MRFLQIDQISQIQPGEFIECRKSLTGNEDYLRDHFPRFAVMPGVLMLEALYQAGNFLVRATENHRPSLVVLRTVKNVKFADFMQPDDTLEIRAEIIKKEDSTYTIKGVGKKGESNAVSGRLVIECVENDASDAIKQLSAGYMRHLIQRLQEASIAP